MKAIFPNSGYSAYTVGNGIRFQLNGSLVKETETPQEVVKYLKVALGIPTERPVTRFDKATSPEETKKVIPVEVSPEPIKDIPLTEEDFEGEYSIESEGSDPSTVSSGDIVSTGANTLPATTGSMPEIAGQLPPTEELPEEFTIFGASLEDLARAMHERFGVYTVFTRVFPETDEISPLTGEPMTNYDRGIAYQAARRAFEQGRLENANYEYIKNEADKARAASVSYQQNAYQVPAQMTEEQNKSQNNFDYRTSVRGANASLNGVVAVPNPDGSGDPIAEPRLMGQPIIRPDW